MANAQPEAADDAAEMQRVFDNVMLAQDLQGAILDTVGLLGIGFGGINRSWCAVVKGRRGQWKVLDCASLTSFGGKGRAPGSFQYARDVTALPQGGIAVADADNDRLQIFSKDVSAGPRVLGGWGKDPGKLHAPWGVACDGESLYVIDSGNHRMQKLRLADGAVLGTVGKADCSRGDGDGHFHYPLGMCAAVDALYVCDGWNNRIVVLGTDLSWRYTFGRKGSGDGEFRGPSAAVMHHGELYVVDKSNHRIQVFAPDRHGRMRFVRAFGGRGSAPGQLKEPQGVAVVRGGLLVVTEETRLQVVTPTGAPLQVLRLGEELANVCAAGGRVWVADWGSIHCLNATMNATHET